MTEAAKLLDFLEEYNVLARHFERINRGKLKERDRERYTEKRSE